MVISKTLPLWSDEVKNFAKKVKIMSNGRLDIRVYGGGDFVPPFETFDAVKDGRLEMRHSASYFWSGKVPGSEFFTSVPFGMNADDMNSWIYSGGGQALWDKLYNDHNIKPIPCGNTGCQMTGWFNKEIKSIADFKGLKMRIPGLGGHTIKKLGASPITLPQTEIYTALSTGTIDATEWVGPYHDYIMGFQKATKFYYVGGWHEPGSMLELIINKEAWASLDQGLQ